MKRGMIAAAVLAAACSGVPAPPPGTDADTAAWWRITGDLSRDAMEGRDTGSAGYDRAADYVEARFRAAELRPAGENRSYRQTLLLKEVRVEKEGTSLEVISYLGGPQDVRIMRPYAFLHDFTVRPSAALPATLSANLVFAGYCRPEDMTAIRGQIVVCFGTRRAGMTTAAQRLDAAAKAGAVGIINVDDPGFTIEPARWPEAYARSVTFRDAPMPAHPEMVVMRFSAEAFETLIEGNDQNAAAILKAGAESKPLPSFTIRATLKAAFATSQRELQADNVLAFLPGTDPVLRNEFVLVSAHLDGYGYGEPVRGDALYNGAFDDAAYVASLIRLAERQAGKGFRRSVVFAAYTGEEKGLLGSNWYAANSTVGLNNIAAVINLDQLRPLFPLKILTMHGIDDTTLATNARRVAGAMGIELRPDMEPERNLNQRTDHFPFLRMGVPAVNFVFGYDPGTEAEARNREWYRSRYHRPQDDMTQPIHWDAARDMNLFFYRLTEDVANDPVRPGFVAGSPWAPD